MIDNLIGGQRVASVSGRSQPVYNPATGDAIEELGLSSADEVAAAVQAAVDAFPAWAATPPLKRASVMFRFNELLIKHADDVAREISREHGKTHDDALGEVQRGREVVEFVCGIPQLLKGEFSRNVGPQIDSYSDRQPLGVCAGITAFNFPAMVPLWMYPVAVAYHSFGGWKRSIFGDHSIYGPEGVHFYTRLKTVTMRWPTDIKQGAVFTFPT